MFGILGGSASIFAGRRDPTKEKAAPPPATPICFPIVSTLELDSTTTHGTPAFGVVEKCVAKIRKPSDLRLELLNSLNLTQATLVPGLQLLPAHEPEPGAKLHNGRAAPTREDFTARSKEILIANDMGYNILAGKMRGDKSAPRLMQFRRFWEGLDGMANYWDTSLDEYFPPGAPRDAKEDDSPVSPKTVTLPLSLPAPVKRQGTSLAEQERPMTDKKPILNGEAEVMGTYCGHRMSNGANMPEQHRMDTVKGFLEPIVWPYGFTVQPPRRLPLLRMGNLRVPTRLSFYVWRLPKEREKAQGKWVEGPVIGVSCRSETNFEPDSTASNADIVHEIATLLMLAQERGREGKTEAKPGEDKWWTAKPRWGGGEGGQTGEGRADEDRQPEEAETGRQSPVPTLGARRPAKAQEPRRRPTMLENWKTLKPGVGYWDPKADFERIGTDTDTVNDQVYLVSSLNHHISLLKLEVHPAYIESLTDGQTPAEAPFEPFWQRPRISRSKWYDLFSPDERLEAMEMLWGLSAHLARIDSN